MTTITAKSGDTYSAIARRYGISWIELAKYNNKVDPNDLKVGEEVKIPEGYKARSQTRPKLKPETKIDLSGSGNNELFAPGTPLPGLDAYLTLKRADALMPKIGDPDAEAKLQRSLDVQGYGWLQGTYAKALQSGSQQEIAAARAEMEKAELVVLRADVREEPNFEKSEEMEKRITELEAKYGNVESVKIALETSGDELAESTARPQSGRRMRPIDDASDEGEYYDRQVNGGDHKEFLQRQERRWQSRVDQLKAEQKASDRSFGSSDKARLEAGRFSEDANRQARLAQKLPEGEQRDALLKSSQISERSALNAAGAAERLQKDGK